MKHQEAHTKLVGKYLTYECTVTIAQFSPWIFTHSNNPPTLGAIKRVKDALIPDVGCIAPDAAKAWRT